MKILALDTTAKSASAAITDGREPLAVFTLEAGLTHSETVLPMIKTALDSLHMTAHDIDLFAATAGPGSFTGVRIGISEIKGLAFATGKPCVGVSTLLSLAYNLRPLCENAILCPVMDARRNQLYNALFRLESGVLTRLCEDRLVSLSDLTAELAGYDEPVYSAGDGYALLKKAAAIADTPRLLIPQSGYSTALLALDTYENTSDKSIFSDSALLPVYLRASQAERDLAEKEQAAK